MGERNDEFRRLFKGADWPRTRAARELGLNPASISRYLSGDIEPSLQVLLLMAERTGQELRLNEDTVPPRLRESARHLETWESELLLLLAKMKPTARAKLIDALRELAATQEAQVRYTGPQTKIPAVEEAAHLVNKLNHLADDPHGSKSAKPPGTGVGGSGA